MMYLGANILSTEFELMRKELQAQKGKNRSNNSSKFIILCCSGVYVDIALSKSQDLGIMYHQPIKRVAEDYEELVIDTRSHKRKLRNQNFIEDYNEGVKIDNVEIEMQKSPLNLYDLDESHTLDNRKVPLRMHKHQVSDGHLLSKASANYEDSPVVSIQKLI